MLGLGGVGVGAGGFGVGGVGVGGVGTQRVPDWMARRFLVGSLVENSADSPSPSLNLLLGTPRFQLGLDRFGSFAG
jgi:hypothetical protein